MSAHRSFLATGMEKSKLGTPMTDEIEALKARRAELEREIESLESTRVALYMPASPSSRRKAFPRKTRINNWRD